jgi:hypothetical protein
MKPGACSRATSWSSALTSTHHANRALSAVDPLHAALWRNALSILTTTGLFAFGVLIWTLLEYIIQRHIFHYEPKTRWGNNCTSLFTECTTITPMTRRGW